jgi:D-tyrosyl-tRNA(Tyr) deacylase
MIALLQRVSQAKVEVAGRITGAIGTGLLVLLCAVKGDGEDDIAYLADKISRIRIFEDQDGRMNRSVRDVGGGILVVSQFTLAAATRKGNRPSFEVAEVPERARELFDAFTARLREAGLEVRMGIFGEKMNIALVNDGPVTIILDSNEKRQG